MNRANDSKVVKEQLANRDVDVFTGKTFDELKESSGTSFDLSSVFSVDEQALSNAFAVDTSAFEGLGDMGDLGGMGDLSGADMGLSGLSGFDASAIQFDSSAMASVFNDETMAKIMTGAPQFSVDSLGEGATNLTEDQQKAVNDGARKFMAAYGAWAMANPTEAAREDSYEVFLATDEGKALQAEMRESLGGIAQDMVSTAMTKYMTEQFAPYFSQQMSTLMTQAGQVMATQLAQQLQQQMAAVTDTLGSSFSLDIASQLADQMDSLSAAMSSGATAGSMKSS
jgi:hypothetical protein